MTVPRPLHKTLGLLEYFTFGFGSMVGVGWLVLMDDWLGRGGPGGANHLGTEAAFARAFGSPGIARLILWAAFLSLFKVMNGNFVAATRMLLALGRRGFVHPSLGAVHPRYGTPGAAIVLMAGLTAVAAFLGDALLVPVTEVGSLAAGVGWCAACAAFVRRGRGGAAGMGLAITGVGVSLAIVLMKIIPGVPGSFTTPEWVALAAWCGLGAAFWLRR